MREALSKPGNADLALEILQVWVLGKNERMVCDFLDALGIKHDGKGLIEEMPAEPEKAKSLPLSNRSSPNTRLPRPRFISTFSRGWKRADGPSSAKSSPRIRLLSLRQ